MDKDKEKYKAKREENNVNKYKEIYENIGINNRKERDGHNDKRQRHIRKNKDRYKDKDKDKKEDIDKDKD